MSLDLYFLNVGHGDCTFIDHPNGHVTMIDVNNSKSLPELDQIALAARHGVSQSVFKGAGVYGRSLEEQYEERLVDPYEFYDAQFSGRSIFRYIQTHPDLDHMSGLCRVFWQEAVELVNFWDTSHTKSLKEEAFEGSRYDYSDWLMYKLLQAGERKDGASHKVLRLNTGALGDYYTGDGIRVLSPSEYLESISDTEGRRNDLSYVLSIEYASRRVILPGDAGSAAWDSILTNVDDKDLDCDILKASHHGRESGYHEKALESMDPSLVICSVGKEPKTDASDEYEAQGATVVSTRDHGTVHVRIWDDGDIWVYNRNEERIHSL